MCFGFEGLAAGLNFARHAFRRPPEFFPDLPPSAARSTFAAIKKVGFRPPISSAGIVTCGANASMLRILLAECCDKPHELHHQSRKGERCLKSRPSMIGHSPRR